MWNATITMPVESKDGTITHVKKDVKLGRIEGTTREAFAYAQQVYNRWGAKVHSVVKLSADEAKSASKEG